MIPFSMAVRPGLLVAAEPGFITPGIFVAGGEVPVRAVKNVADGIAVAEEALLQRHQASSADPGLVVGDPMADLELHHLTLAIREVEFKCAAECVRCLLVVVKQKVSAHGRDSVRKLEAQSPARDVHLMNALVAEVSVACIPDPVPVVMKAIARKWFQRRRPSPEVVIDPGWNRLRRRVSNRVAPLVAKSARQMDLANHSSIVKPLDRFLDRGRGPNLRAMLNDAIVFLSGAYELAAFPEIMRTGFFDIHVFACLARPDGNQGMPMVGRGDGNGVDGFVFEQLANIGECLGIAAHFSAAFIHNFLVHVAEGGNLGVRHVRISVKMIVSAIAQAADGYTNAIVRAKDFFRAREKSNSAECRKACGCLSGRLQKIPSCDIRLLWHDFSYFSCMYSMYAFATCASRKSPW